VKIELLSVPDCPNVAAARRLLRSCIADAGIDLEVVEAVGEFPSPTIRVNGRDVMGEVPPGAYCRLDLPTREKVTAAINSAT